METEKEKSIRFPQAVHAKLQKLALKLGRTQLQVFVQMVDYFYRSGKDPRDLNEGILLRQLGKNHDWYVSFIRKQESELLIPIKNDMELVTSQYDALMNTTTKIGQGTERLQVSQREVDRVLRIVAEKIQTKDILKKRFTEIFERYIANRERFGLMTSGKEKEDLLSATRFEIHNI